MSWAAVAGMTFFVYSTVGVVGQNSASPTNIANRATTASSSQSNAVRLSYGVADVLKLAQAQVGEDTIVAFVRNSGTSYNLSAAEIIHLKNQGVPDHVLTAMLEQSKVVETTARIAANAQAASVARAARPTAPNSRQLTRQPRPCMSSRVHRRRTTIMTILITMGILITADTTGMALLGRLCRLD